MVNTGCVTWSCGSGIAENPENVRRKVRDGGSGSEQSVGKEREPGEYSRGEDEVEGEVAYAFLRNGKNTEGYAEVIKKEESERRTYSAKL